MGELRPCERLLLADGREATVKAARVEAAARDGLGRPVQTAVYNFQVKGWHSYFAAPNEGATLGEFAWVHNADRYARPSSFRKGVRDTVWERAKEKSTGRVRDPKTGQFMSKDKPWDMGHKPRHEYRKFKASAKAQKMSRAQVLEHHNNPVQYRPELPSSNRGHALEDKSSRYSGP